MRLKTTLILAGILSAFGSNAQTPCDQGRYSTDLFPNVTVTSNVQFGTNDDYVGASTDLFMDIYEPTGDTELERPLIIWAHGGSFIGGTRTDGDVVALADAFAKKGFVCASIDYRVGMWPIDSVNAVKAVVRAVQDMRGATRFFYADRATSNTYKIDTTKIFIGGSSAGAITALHMAYLDKECEVEPYVDLPTINSMGGLEGTSGSPGYSSDVVGVINLAGALASYGWMEAGDVPLCSMQGTEDGTVPYNRGAASVSFFNVIYMDGSRMLYEQANTVGVEESTYSHYGAGHAPYAMGGAYMDTTINFVRDFLIDQFGCTDTPLQPANAPLQIANLYQLFYCGLGIDEETIEVNVYPNPSNDIMNIELPQGLEVSAKVLDLSGREVLDLSTGNQFAIDKSKVGAGQYLLRLTNSDGVAVTEKIVFE
jgi:hypothetical protein